MDELLVIAWNTPRQREKIRNEWMARSLIRPSFHTIEKGDAHGDIPTVGIAVAGADTASNVKERLLAAGITVIARAACQECGGLLNACACRQ